MQRNGSLSAGAKRKRTQTVLVAIVSIVLAFGFILEYQRTALTLHLSQIEAASSSLPTSSSSSSSLNLPFGPEIWAGGYDQIPSRQTLVAAVRNAVGDQEIAELSQMCGRVMYETLSHSLSSHGLDDWTFVSTGDIREMWIRDSAVQMAIYVPKIRKHPALRRLVEGAIRTQAYFTIQDPYGNSFYPEWTPLDSLSKTERRLGRGGWTGTRNYELDSGAYFIQALWNYYASGVHGPEKVLSDPLIFDAVSVLVDTWRTEQHHEQLSKYRYAELPRDGLGTETAYTGMTWTGYRPSDDPTIYGYSIPSNIYAAGALERAIELNNRIWHDEDLNQRAQKLLNDIEYGVRQFGVVEVEPGVKVYAFEVDGKGLTVTDMDDANIPSLISIPLLGWTGYDKEIYAATRSRLLDKETNKYFFKGSELEGIGSPHTGQSKIWALAVVVRALTAEGNVQEISEELKRLLKMQCGSGTMHESVDVDHVSMCTRTVFQWANAAAVTAIESMLGVDCDEEAEKVRLDKIIDRETHGNGGDNPLYYETLESHVARDKPSAALKMPKPSWQVAGGKR